MGGFMQPQGHAQVMVNMIDFGLDPQSALDTNRFCIEPSGIVFEEGIPESVIQELKKMGHQINDTPVLRGAKRLLFGKGQIITRDPVTGALCGGSDPRSDGCAIGF